MNKFFTPTSIRVSSRLNDYLKENFGYTIDGDIKELQKAKVTLERMQESGKNYVETTMMLEAIKALLKVRVDEVSSDLAKRYKKNAKVDMEINDEILDRDGNTNDAATNRKLHQRNSKRAKGIQNANKRIGEAAKPDFLDVDKDGNKKEPMKKALADKKKKVNEVDMGQAKSAQDKKDSRSVDFKVTVNGKVMSHHGNDYTDAEKAAKKLQSQGKKNIRIVSESVTLQRVLLSQLNAILEGDAASAEITMAARGIVDELQDIIEKLGKIQNDQLGPLADQMAYSHGADQSSTFKSSVDEAISGLLDNARSAKDAVNNAVLVLSGEQPATDTMAPSSEDIGGDMADDFEDDIEADIDTDVVGGDEAMSGPKEEPLGRARR